MSKDKASKRPVISARGMMDSAPSARKATYLKLPERIRPFQPEVNRLYRLVFLPWKAGEGNPSTKKGEWAVNRFICVHRNIGPADEHYLCPAKCYGRPCVWCDVFQQERTAGKKSWDQIKGLKAKDRELFFVHDLEDNKTPQNLMVWDESIALFGDAFRQKIRRRSEWMAFASFDGGSIIEIEGKKKAIEASSCTDFSTGIEIVPRSEPLEDWLFDACDKYCIDDFVVEVPQSKLKKMLSQVRDGEEEQEEEQEEQEETEQESRRAKRSTRAVREVEENGEEDENEPPTRSRTSTTRSRSEEPEEPEEEEEEDESEEEDEPEPVPVKPKRPARPKR